MMLLRLRSRDGLERIQVDDRATVGDLQQKIEEQLQVPIGNQVLSQDIKLLVSKTPQEFADMRDPKRRLSQLGMSNGAMVFLYYSGERQIAGPSSQQQKAFSGGKMTIDDMIARQTRIERQEDPHATSVSFDRNAANVFQAYINESLGFSIKRGGVMYGSVAEDKSVLVDTIYEPPQQGSEDGLEITWDTEELARVELVAQGLGLKKVGFIFSQSVSQVQGKEYIVSEGEMRQMVELQADSGDDTWVTALVKLDADEESGGADVHFEAFQTSDQCVKLWREGFFAAKDAGGSKDPKTSLMGKEVIVAGRDTTEVDNDFFLVPVKILDHEGPLVHTFPVENRLPSANFQSVKAHLDKYKNYTYAQRLSDFHLLVFLSRYIGDAADIVQIAETVRSKGQVGEGYQLIIESLASQ